MDEKKGIIMEMTHLRAPLNKYTFKSRKIKEWVEKHCNGETLNLFAGQEFLQESRTLSEFRNDIREDMPADTHMDALDFVRGWSSKPFGTIVLDPPYSYRKSMEMYEGAVSSRFNQVKNNLPRILIPKGRVITLGYHSVSMGKSRGFELEAVCVISHGGAIHDTIISVERKL
jgi:hypothetical protein